MALKPKPTVLAAVTLLALVVLPSPGAAVRMNPLGPYRLQAKTEVEYLLWDEDRTDTLDVTLTRRAIFGQVLTVDDVPTFTVRFRQPIMVRPGPQTFTFSGRRNIDMDDFEGKVALDGQGRVQRTRTGRFKLSGTYSGEVEDGDFEGAEVDGRFNGWSR